MAKKYNIERVEVIEDVDGTAVHNVGSDLAGADPSVYGRLMRAKKYDKAAKMRGHKMYRVEAVVEQTEEAIDNENS